MYASWHPRQVLEVKTDDERTQLYTLYEEWPHFCIPLVHGKQLAARAWLPTNVSSCPVPAILEYIPYKKRDGTATRDEQMHP